MGCHCQLLRRTPQILGTRVSWRCQCASAGKSLQRNQRSLPWANLFKKGRRFLLHVILVSLQQRYVQPCCLLLAAPKGCSQCASVGGVGLAVGRRCYLSWVYGGSTVAVLRAVLLSLYLSHMCIGRLVLELLLRVGLRMLLPQWQILSQKGCDACSKLSRGRCVMQQAAFLYCMSVQ